MNTSTRSLVKSLRERVTMLASLADALEKCPEDLSFGHKPAKQRGHGGKRQLSAAGRRSIKRAQKARWAAWRKKNGVKGA